MFYFFKIYIIFNLEMPIVFNFEETNVVMTRKILTSKIVPDLFE